MQTTLKNRKKRDKRNKTKLSQRGGSGHSHSSRRSQKNNMPSGYHALKQEIENTKFAAQFPPVPKYIPGFNITVRTENLEELKKIFTSTSLLNDLILSYRYMHLRLLDLAPEDIKKRLLEANNVLERLITLLQNKFIYNPKGADRDADKALLAGKWCDYIGELIKSNKKNITEINEFLSKK